jgi:hypothetical protein
MFRTIALAFATATAIGAAALISTPASAAGGHGGGHHGGGHHGGGHHGGWHGGGHYHGGWHGGHGRYRHGHFRGPRVIVGSAPAYVGYNPCLRRQWVPSPYGPRLRVVNICY